MSAVSSTPFTASRRGCTHTYNDSEQLTPSRHLRRCQSPSHIPLQQLSYANDAKVQWQWQDTYLDLQDEALLAGGPPKDRYARQAHIR